MAAGDYSLCVEFSASYSNYFKFDSGKFAVVFDCTGDTQDGIIGKNPTLTEITKQVFYLEYAKLGCTTTSARIYDGSAGSILFSVLASDVSGVNSNADCWDFRKDPLKCLTAESTSSLCLSSGDGYVCGLIKGFWGRG